MTDNPVLNSAVEMVREVTGLDITLHSEGGRYFLRAPDRSIWGPMEHSQAWYALVGVMWGRHHRPTLETETRVKERERRQRFEGVMNKVRYAEKGPAVSGEGPGGER